MRDAVARAGAALRELLQPVTVAIVLMVVAFGVGSPYFLSSANWYRVLSVYLPELALLAVASALVLLIAGIDLSVVAVSALSAVTVAVLVEAGQPLAVAVVTGLLVGALCGLLNGLLVVVGRVPSIMTTLITQFVFAGVALGMTDGRSIGGLPAELTALAASYVGPVPVALLLVLGVTAVVGIVLRGTIVGRWVYAVGGNAPAAHLSGVPVRAVTIGVYAAASLIAALAGVLAAGRYGAANVNINGGLTLYAITAAILGGVSIFGGRGRIVWVVVGALAVAVLQNGMTVIGQPGYLQSVAVGALLIVTVLTQQLTARIQRRSNARRLRRGIVAPQSRLLERK